MSGPKTSNYTLTPEQKRIIKEQVLKERKIQLEKDKLSVLIADSRSLQAELKKPLENINVLLRRTGEGQDFIDQAVQAISDIDTVLSNVSNNQSFEGIAERRKNVEEIFKTAYKRSKILFEKTKELNISLYNDIEKGIDLGFKMSYADVFEKSIGNLERSIDKTRMNAALDEVRIIRNLPRDLIEEINRAISKIETIENDEFLDNFRLLTISPLIKKCKKYAQDYKENGERFEDLLSAYKAICKALDTEENEYTFSLENISLVESQIRVLEAELFKQKENEYISNSIDEVMTEMGYSLLGYREVVKKSGKRFRDQLFSFSDSAAVNIRYESDGKIAMELGGIDNEDRIPTTFEKENLCKEMEGFCRSFYDIEKKLQTKGIVLKNRISILPPKAEYAQIINTLDYNLNQELRKEKTELRKTKKTLFKKQIRNE